MKRRAKKVVLAVLLFPLLATVVIGLSGEVASAGGDSGRNAAIEKIVSYLRGKKADMNEDRLKAVVHSVCDQSQKHDVDYRLVLALIKVESNFRQDVVSKGAHGLFQIKPSTGKVIAKRAGVDWEGSQSLHEADKSVKLGVYHLSKLVGDFKSVPTALHAYNVGEDSAKTKGRGKGEPKTAFTKRVLKEYEKNLSILPDAEELDKQ